MHHPARSIIPILLFIGLLLLFTPNAQAQNTTYIINGVPADTPSTNPADNIKTLEVLSNSSTRYTDFAYGYTLVYPSHMSIDTSLSAVSTVIYDEKTRIEIFYDNFQGTPASSEDYIAYGNRFLQNTRDHSLELETTMYKQDFKVHLLKWSRRKLSRVSEDKNHYLSAEYIKNANEVYTIIIKSSEPITNEMPIINSFRLVKKQGLPRNFKPSEPARTRLNPETKSFFNTYFADASPLRWGIFEPSAPEDFQYLIPLEERLGYTFPVLLRYQSLEENLPRRGLQKAYDNGKFVELTLQTVLEGHASTSPAGFTHKNASIIYDILDGKYDDYLNTYAQEIKAFGHPVLFRLNNEMNGDWCWYSAFYTSKDPEIYKALWRYIYETFEHNGVDNVLWVWNPHDLSRPEFKWNHFMMYYPGDEYVDIIGLTGYNTGTYFPGERWREFSTIYRPMYAEYMELFTKPFMITEFGSNSVGGDKTAWINNMFDEIKHYPNIKIAIWWSGIDYDEQGRPGRIYVINENEQISDTFQRQLKAWQ